MLQKLATVAVAGFLRQAFLRFGEAGMDNLSKVRVVAVASGGGHWEQLLLVSEAFKDEDILFVTTKEELLKHAGITNGRVVPDCNRDHPLLVLKSIASCMNIIFSTRPHVVISTGAAPGLICLALGRLIGANTIWLDSFANVERLSMSGKMARYFAKVWLTQWEHLSTAKGPRYMGQLL
jgi:UDP-N-acetylglucosamine:LPS N-acetylglucosamine transferase